MSQELNDFFKLLAEDKKHKKEEFNSIVGDLGLNSLFGEFAALKKKEKEKKIEEQKEQESIIGKITLDSVFEEIANLKKETKKKKVQEEKTVKAFEKWLYSETTKEQEQIIEDVIEESLDEVLEVLEDHKKELEEPTLIEKSLGLLAEPSDVKVQQDPITPLDQKFATLDDLQKHYSTFLSRIQQQISTIGGGGETNLAYMDMPLTYVTTSTYTIKPQDYYIGINYAGAVTITLPTPRKNGKTYIVKDERGEASKGANRHIYIYPSGSDLIDEEDYAILAYDYGSLTFVYRNGWRVV